MRIVRAPPENMEVVLGSVLTLECVIEGSPVPWVGWDKYGGSLPEGRFTQDLGEYGGRVGWVGGRSAMGKKGGWGSHAPWGGWGKCFGSLWTLGELALKWEEVGSWGVTGR